jgi:hypothetical protein
MVSTVRVYGTLRGVDGQPVEGAVVDVALKNQMIHEGTLLGNSVLRTYTDSYGKFSLDLVPSSLNMGNYYEFTIVHDAVVKYRKIVGSSVSEINFEDLADFSSPGQQFSYIGGSQTGTGSFTYVPQSSSVDAWRTATADGVAKIFTTPAGSTINLVALDGITQSPNVDYFKRANNAIEFYTAPFSTQLVALSYRTG